MFIETANILHCSDVHEIHLKFFDELVADFHKRTFLVRRSLSIFRLKEYFTKSFHC